MPYFDWIDVSEEIDVNKTSASKKCGIYNYWYFLDKGFKFQPNVRNRCHDLLMMSINLSNISSDYRCFISGISKIETINLIQNTELIEKSKTSHTINLLSCKKMG